MVKLRVSQPCFLKKAPCVATPLPPAMKAATTLERDTAERVVTKVNKYSAARFHMRPLSYMLIGKKPGCLPQVSYLEKKVTELESDSLANGDLKTKLKQENTQLVHR